MPVIGFLSNGFRQSHEAFRLIPFREGLQETGYVEGRNVATVGRPGARKKGNLRLSTTQLHLPAQGRRG